MGHTASLREKTARERDRRHAQAQATVVELAPRHESAQHTSQSRVWVVEPQPPSLVEPELLEPLLLVKGD